MIAPLHDPLDDPTRGLRLTFSHRILGTCRSFLAFIRVFWIFPILARNGLLFRLFVHQKALELAEMQLTQYKFYGTLVEEINSQSAILRTCFLL